MFPSVDLKNLGWLRTIAICVFVAAVVGGLSVYGSVRVADSHLEATKYQARLNYKVTGYADFLSGVHQIFTIAWHSGINIPTNSGVNSLTNQSTGLADTPLLDTIYEWTRDLFVLMPFLSDKATRDLYRDRQVDYAQWAGNLTSISPDQRQELTITYREYEDFFREELLEDLFPVGQ